MFGTVFDTCIYALSQEVSDFHKNPHIKQINDQLTKGWSDKYFFWPKNYHTTTSLSRATKLPDIYIYIYIYMCVCVCVCDCVCALFITLSQQTEPCLLRCAVPCLSLFSLMNRNFHTGQIIQPLSKCRRRHVILFSTTGQTKLTAVKTKIALENS